MSIDDKGVYQIRNTVTGAIYIGSTGASFRQRWHEHRSALRRGTHGNIYMRRSWAKHGESAFVFEILVTCTHTEDVHECERSWLAWMFEHISPHQRYNRYPDPTGPVGMAITEAARQKLKSRRPTSESRDRMSVAQRKRFDTQGVSDETRRRMGLASRNRVVSDETRTRQSISLKGRKLGALHRQHLSDASRRSPAKQAGPHHGSAKPFRLLSPDGDIYEGMSLRYFCTTHNLNYPCLAKVQNGTRKQWKGWVLAPPGNTGACAQDGSCVDFEVYYRSH